MPDAAFLTHLQEHFQKVPGKSHFREKSWQKFLELGLPCKSDSSFQYVRLRDLYSSTFQPVVDEVTLSKAELHDAILPECAHSHIVFVDGVYTPSLSDTSGLPPQAVVLSLEEAFSSHGSFLQGHLTRFLKEEKDPFACLSLSLNRRGVFLYLPPKIEAGAPLQCLHVTTGKLPQLSSSHLHLVLGAQSLLRCVVTSKQEAESPHLHLPMMQISLEEGAHLDLFTLVEGSSWQMQTVRATLKRDARLHSLSMTVGGRAARQSYRIALKGENSEAHLNGLWMLDKNFAAHTHATIEHQAPHTRSMQRFKGVLKGFSHSSFEGKILVEQQAQKTEAYQLNNNLILSPGAIAYSKPNLEVFADDVKASHGATVSQVDEKQLFYLRARGIDLKAARELVIAGFCREMIDAIPYAGLHQKMREVSRER